MIKRLFILVILLGFTFQMSYSQGVSITTEKETYYYGDHLTFTITVDVVTGSLATLYVVDESGKRGSPIPIPISQIVTTTTAPEPFRNETYSEGVWTLMLEYNGVADQVEFSLEDSGQLVFPIWFLISGKLWVNDQINENVYAGDIRRLVKENIISMPPDNNSEKISAIIPYWVKTTTVWWTVGLISDQEYADSLEFLIKKEIIII